VYCGGQRIAMHARAEHRHQIITLSPHHQGMLLGTKEPAYANSLIRDLRG
jgi:hypothetical protein